MPISGKPVATPGRPGLPHFKPVAIISVLFQYAALVALIMICEVAAGVLALLFKGKVVLLWTSVVVFLFFVFFCLSFT